MSVLQPSCTLSSGGGWAQGGGQVVDLADVHTPALFGFPT